MVDHTFSILVLHTEKIPVSPRILGGTAENIDTYNWLVAVYANTLQDFNCAGALITPKWVLTSGHHTRYKNVTFKVRAGSNSTGYGGIVVNVAEVFHPPNFEVLNENQSLNDIALLRLVSSLDGPSIGYIDIPNFNEDLKAHEKIDVLGWGLSDRRLRDYQQDSDLRHDNFNAVTMVAFDREICEKIYKFVAKDFVIIDTHICLGYYAYKEAGPCVGDQGSPAITTKSIIGILTRESCIAAYYPAVYTKISSFSVWIACVVNHDPMLF